MHVSSEQRKMKAWLLLLCLAWAGVSAGPVTITSTTPVRGVFQVSVMLLKHRQSHRTARSS